MNVTGYFTDSDDTEYKYDAYVHLDADGQLDIDRVTDRKGNKKLDFELNMYCEFTDEWLEVEQDHDIFFERDLENKLLLVINEQWSKHDLTVDREEFLLGV